MKNTPTFQRSNVFIMDKYVKIARDILLTNIKKEEYAVFLFGRRAREKAGRSSDIDIGILGKKPFDEAKKRRILDLFKDSIIPYHVDLVDFYSVNPEFKKIALRTIQIWNKPEHIVIS